MLTYGVWRQEVIFLLMPSLTDICLVPGALMGPGALALNPGSGSQVPFLGWD